MPQTQLISAPLLGALLAACVLLGGCASLVHGTNQEVRIQSNPSDARILINGHYYGQTPRTLNLRRKELHIVRLEKDGYLPYEIALERTFSAWTAGNAIIGDLVFGGAVGVAVDAADGAFYKLYPDHVVATLSPEAARASIPEDVPEDQRLQPLPDKNTARMLINLHEMYDAGVLSPQEYAERRQRLLDRAR